MGYLKSPSKSGSGFSLVEVLVALAISMVIASAMATLFAQSIKSREQIDRQGATIESGRYALDAMSDDIRLAGFYADYMPRGSTALPWPTGSAAGGAAVTWTTPEPCETAVASMGWSGTIGGVRAPVQIMGYEAHPANKNASPLTLSTTLTPCLANYKAGTDVLVIRRLSTVPFAPTVAASATTTTVGDVYLQGSSCTSTTDGSVPLLFAALPSGGANFTLHQLDCTTVSQIRKYIVRIFYIADCNTCSGGGADSIPTLKVAELSYSGGSLQMVARPLTPGIENMHFEFGVDSSGDGAPDSYAISNEAPLTTAPGFSWQNVMSVKTYLLVRDAETTPGYTSAAEYVFGSRTIKAFTGSSANYKRTVAASTIRLVNPSGARETP